MKGPAALAFAFVALLACGTLVPTKQREVRWYRGNTHTHTLWSDGDAAPEMVIRWYRDHGYDFLALTEHNVLAHGDRWARIRDEGSVTPGRVGTLQASFGDDWVETRRLPDGSEEMRLKPLEELRLRFDSGSFRLITGEEVSDAFLEKPLHINAVNLEETIRPQGGTSLIDTVQRNFDAIAAQGERLGRPVLAHLNHPNFHWALTAEEIAHIRGESFFEIYNGHPSVHNAGDAAHVGAERMWDIALTLRLTELGLGLLYGVAVDDAHNYYEYGLGRANPGRGWVMVRAEELEAASLIQAMKRGDFYATSGVILKDVIMRKDKLSVVIEAEPRLTYTTTFIGTRETDKGVMEVGQVLYSTTANPARFEFEGNELYVRAKVTSSRAHSNPSEEGEAECAWTQPVLREAR
jgi:hypothetical protein